MSKTCGRLAALVILANAMVAMYVFLGSGRGGTSLAGLFSHHSHSSRSKSDGMATSLWSHVDSSEFDPQVILKLPEYYLARLLQDSSAAAQRLLGVLALKIL